MKGCDGVDIKISPIFYMGNKKKLIKKGLIELFPKNINRFIDLFSGSAVVAMNTSANIKIINDINMYLCDLYNMFKIYDSDYIIDKIENYIDKYHLARERTKRNVFQDRSKIEDYKQAYIKLREDYNTYKDVFRFYTLMFYSFSQQFRFNLNGDFNMPYGNDCFCEENKTYIQNGCDFFKHSYITNYDFRVLKVDKLSKNDFVYFDPPYLNTTAVYNENNGWTIDDEKDLLLLCENLNYKGIRWGMSNVFEHKGILNTNLIEWCEHNQWNVFTFNNFTYMACGKGNTYSKEVFICNY